MRKNTALKVILYSIFGIFLLWLVKEILFPVNYYGFGINFNGIFGGDHMYMNGGYGFGAGTFTVLFVFLIKLLIVIFVITLVIGLLMAAKNYLFNTQDLSAFKNSFTQADKSKKTCVNCGNSLEKEWKVCPYCLTEINENNY